MKAVAILLVCVALAHVAADVYMHAPRGSNNRLDDENRDRDNGNRLFDSQNNNRGGYNVGSVYFYTDSDMPVEWTNQHSCGNPNNFCEVIIQFMCDDRVRDGTTTTTIPAQNKQCYNWNCDTDVRYGRHESYDWYKQCVYRSRNKGLFNANQQLNGNGATYTRQNPNGDRRGYECPEERDYYPYWTPTPWMDIAVLTNQPRRCAEYVAESQNVKARWYCVLPAGYVQDTLKKNANANGFIPIDQDKCEQIKWYDAATNATQYGRWTKKDAWGIPAPVCRENAWSRDNHLGNVEGGYAQLFNWTVPSHTIHEKCVLRLRYNISTNDLGPSETANWLSATSVQSSTYLNATLNEPRQPPNRYPAKVDVWSKFRLAMSDNAASFNPNTNNAAATLKTSREYVFKNNPKVDIFGSLLPGGDTKFQLAINTNQFGRTFQDRSHRFAIRARPAALAGAKIHNLQVKGKRGNIVQVFPGTEYDFFPHRLEIQRNDYIHFQWTGSNTNPNNNAGQGRQGSDRSNVVMLRGPVYDEGQKATNPPTFGQWGRSFPADIRTAPRFLGLDVDTLRHLAILDTPGGQLGGEMSELDDAGTYFDLQPVQASQNGIYHYVGTRNNNFSNRDQKGVIIVSDSTATTEALGWTGGEIQGSGGARLVAAQGVLDRLHIVTVENNPSSSSEAFGNADSDIVNVQPLQFYTAPGTFVQVQVPYSRNGLATPHMYRSDNMTGPFEEVSASFSGGVATADTTQGGYFAVKNVTNWGAVAGVIIGCVVAIVALTFFIYRWRAKKAAGGR